MPAALRYAEIRFNGHPAGILRETPAGGSLFEYAPEFPEEIACALPRAQAQHPWPQGLHPFFEHLGPEGWLRARQARGSELALEDDLGILLAYGQDCIGAVSVHDPAPTAVARAQRDLDPLSRAAIQVRRTISGVQPKLLATRVDGTYQPAESDGPAPFIAKFATTELPSIVANEDLSLRVARLLLGADQVAVAERATVNGIAAPALLVRRFDRTAENGKLRLEDFAQVLARPQRRDFSGKYDAGFEDGAEAIRRYSARSRIDLLRYFQRIVVYALLGNCDCHLKNFSLLETAEGLRLAPAYDVANTYIYGRLGYSTRFGLRIGGAHYAFDQLNRELVTDLGRRIGLTEQAVRKTFADLAARQPRLSVLLSPPGPAEADELREAYAETVRSAALRLFPETA